MQSSTSRVRCYDPVTSRYGRTLWPCEDTLWQYRTSPQQPLRRGQNTRFHAVIRQRLADSTAQASGLRLHAPSRSPIQETAISGQFVPGMRFLVFDFGV
eukprot:3434317-Rhodomonas_salina.1